MTTADLGAMIETATWRATLIQIKTEVGPDVRWNFVLVNRRGAPQCHYTNIGGAGRASDGGYTRRCRRQLLSTCHSPSLAWTNPYERATSGWPKISG